MIHAFFKALLFLGAGAVIHLLHHEHDIFKMGGLRHKLPVIYWTFLIGSASLAALPLVTAGFYSKDAILWMSLASEQGNPGLFLLALIGAFVTAIYTFRMVFVTFFGEEKTHVSHPAGMRMTLPLIILAVLSTVAGFIELPHTFGHVQLFTDFLSPVLPEVAVQPALEHMEWLVQVGAAVLSLAGVYVAYYFFIRKPELADYVHETSTMLHRFWYSGWGFDAAYNTVFVRPFVYLATINKRDVVDKLYQGMVALANGLNSLLAWTQSGLLRWYMIGIVIGAIVMVTLGLWVGR